MGNTLRFRTLRRTARSLGLTVATMMGLFLLNHGCAISGECPQGWPEADDPDDHVQCQAPDGYSEEIVDRLGAAYYGYSVVGQRVSDGDDACTFEASELAPGFKFNVGYKLLEEGSDKPVDSGQLDITTRSDGTWEFEAKPNYQYSFPEFTFGPTRKLRPGEARLMVVFNVITC